MAKFVHEGNAIDYTPGADVAAGDVVVLDASIGVANDAIPSGRLGALAVEGVFELPKDATAFALGESIDWSGTQATAGTVAAIGICARPALTGDAVVWCKLVPRV